MANCRGKSEDLNIMKYVNRNKNSGHIDYMNQTYSIIKGVIESEVALPDIFISFYGFKLEVVTSEPVSVPLLEAPQPAKNLKKITE